MYDDFNVSEFTQQLQNNCLKIQVKKIKKNEIITNYINDKNQICILKKGIADLIRYDKNGNKTILETFKQNDIFGEIFFPIRINNELFTIAKENCEILYFTYDDISVKCTQNCKFHESLNNNLLKLFLYKIRKQNLRVELLTKRTIREKLESYFSFLETNNAKKSFTIPFSYTDLADYLSIDRSAMMRELKSLQQEGLISRDGNNITLKY